jgi:hypothetical protein
MQYLKFTRASIKLEGEGEVVKMVPQTKELPKSMTRSYAGYLPLNSTCPASRIAHL